MAWAKLSRVITLPVAGTLYNLRSEIISQISALAPVVFKELTLTMHDGNVTDVVLGDASLTSLIYGQRLSALQSMTYRSNINDIGASQIYLIGLTTASLKVLIDGRVG